jgi:hypothetical protein
MTGASLTPRQRAAEIPTGWEITLDLIRRAVDALAGAEPITHSDCYILKLHGDYKDARILNTEAELSGYPAEYDALLDQMRSSDPHRGRRGQLCHRRCLLSPPRQAQYGCIGGEHGSGAANLGAPPFF